MLLRWRGHRVHLGARVRQGEGRPHARVSRIDSTNYGILFHLGVLRYVSGDFDGAAAMFRRAQPRAPDGGERAGSTDWLWLSLARGGHLAEANAMLATRPDSLPGTAGLCVCDTPEALSR